jgi:hypothetical protein
MDGTGEFSGAADQTSGASTWQQEQEFRCQLVHGGSVGGLTSLRDGGYPQSITPLSGPHYQISLRTVSSNLLWPLLRSSHDHCKQTPVARLGVRSFDHPLRSASASINAFIVPNAFIRRADFFAELRDEVCEFHSRIDDSNCVLSAFLQHVRICKVSRNGSTTHEVGEPYECYDDR